MPYLLSNLALRLTLVWFLKVKSISNTFQTALSVTAKPVWNLFHSFSPKSLLFESRMQVGSFALFFLLINMKFTSRSQIVGTQNMQLLSVSLIKEITFSKISWNKQKFEREKICILYLVQDMFSVADNQSGPFRLPQVGVKLSASCVEKQVITTLHFLSSR